MVLVTQQLSHALKEWAIAVDALTTGKTIVLLRKGGIRESRFTVQNSLVWLYPTYEHQKPELLKPDYAGQVSAVPSGWHPQTVTIKSCAEITDVLPLNNYRQIAALQPYHIWNESMICDRLKWKSQTPLMLLLLRVYRCPLPHTIPFNQLYGGCKSWIDLIEPLTTANLLAVSTTSVYQQQVTEIKAQIASN